ncbi:hypothetical protein [Saccharopolyspora mangrovi]|uniref:hypothetical protein n=1 Tax=Saccharopolyspora mangrovi TaxID=3082379 RepID=UPI00389A8A2D
MFAAVAAERDEPVGAALLAAQRTTYYQVKYGTHVYRASRYTLDMSLRGET